MTTILVAGATGSVGSHVTRELTAREVSVRVLVRNAARAEAVLGGDVHAVVADFADPRTMRHALAGVDAVFLACANDPRQVEYETNVIDCAVDAGVPRLVKLSAIGAEIGSPLPFWDSNARIEQHLEDSRMIGTVIRASFLMSNLLPGAATIRQTGRLFLPGGEAAVALTDPRDVATAAAVALMAPFPPEEVHITGPESLTFAEVAERLTTVVGSTVGYVDVPDEAAGAAMAEAGMPEWLVTNILVLYGLIRQGELAKTTPDFAELTGQEPRSLAEFVRDHATMFRGLDRAQIT